MSEASKSPEKGPRERHLRPRQHGRHRLAILARSPGVDRLLERRLLAKPPRRARGDHRLCRRWRRARLVLRGSHQENRHCLRVQRAAVELKQRQPLSRWEDETMSHKTAVKPPLDGVFPLGAGCYVKKRCCLTGSIFGAGSLSWHRYTGLGPNRSLVGPDRL